MGKPLVPVSPDLTREMCARILDVGPNFATSFLITLKSLLTPERERGGKSTFFAHSKVEAVLRNALFSEGGLLRGLAMSLSSLSKQTLHEFFLRH